MDQLLTWLRAVGLAAGLALAASPTAAAGTPADTADDGPPDPTRSWLAQSNLTGDWGGLRTDLHRRGLDPWASYVGGFLANVTGGFDTGIRYEGFADWGLRADLSKAVGWPGGHFQIGWYSYHGGEPGLELIGPFDTTFPSPYETGPAIRFYEIFLRQEAWRGNLELKIGQLAAGSDFFVSSEADALLNGTFGYLALGRDQQLGPFYPLAAPGIYGRVDAGEHWSLRAGVYTADVGSARPGNIGFGWGFDDGVVVLVEGAARWRPLGRRGRYAAGFLGTTASGLDFESQGTVRGGYAFYALVDQTLVVDRAGREQLGAFLRTQVAPLDDRSELDWYLDGGLKWTGPLSSRPDDVASLGVAYLRFGRDYVAFERGSGNDVSARQLVVELTYRVQLAGWLTLQPDVQVFVDPHLSRRNAVGLGLLATINL